MNNGGNNQQEEASDTNGWMTTYSDMMTLLFAFFVLLFALSSADPQKSQLLAAALSKDGLSLELFQQIQEKYSLIDTEFYYNNGLKNIGKEASNKQGLDDEAFTGYYGDQLGKLYASITEYIEGYNMTESISTEYRPDGILVVLKNDVWFATGQAEINQNALESAIILSQMLRDTFDDNSAFDIVVAGHTDNVPIKSARYPSNWELSMDRAISFLHILVRESGLSSSHFSARGYGEEAPIADNSTPEGRQQNRRVEILISVPPTS